jgi:hypothetical protein
MEMAAERICRKTNITVESKLKLKFFSVKRQQKTLRTISRHTDGTTVIQFLAG